MGRKYLSLSLTCLILMTGMMAGSILTVKIWADELAVTGPHQGDDLSGNPRCTDCHEGDTVNGKPIRSFNHQRDWYETHQFHGSSGQRLCQSCHALSFCTECHAARDELKPSLKQSGKPDRHLPHRGNYLIRHRIDGRINPVQCYGCHGRRNNRQCKECHKSVR